jgi:hypothetical protein
MSMLVIFTTFTGTLALPANVMAAPTFTAALRTRFAKAIIEFGKLPYEFNRFAIHDFEGDGIPELLLGVASEANQLYVSYGVFKYDIIGDRFVSIGGIAESRYLMKDRYSNAIIGYYHNNTAGRTFTVYRNYYLVNNTLSRNTPLAQLSGNNNTAVYDGKDFSSGNYINDQLVSVDEYNQEVLNLRSSYDELMVYDYLAGNEVAYVVTYSWKPSVLVKRPIVFNSNDSFTKVWQGPMLEFLDETRKMGPANTKVDEWAIDQSIRKEDYQRYALYDIDADNVPELFLAVQRSMKLSFDVYKYWNGDMRFIGSFDAYSKYLAKANTGVFAFNPHESQFAAQSANRISVSNYAVKNDTLLMSYYKNNKYEYFAPGKDGVNLVSANYDNYLNSLINYVNAYPEIKTFDIQMTVPRAVLIMYIKTKAFTIQ